MMLKMVKLNRTNLILQDWVMSVKRMTIAVHSTTLVVSTTEPTREQRAVPVSQATWHTSDYPTERASKRTITSAVCSKQYGLPC